MVKLTTKMIFLSLFISLIPLILLGMFNINMITTSQSESMQDSLSSIVASRESALEEYIEDTELFAQAISRSLVVQSFLKKPTDLNREEVESLVYNIQEINWGRYHHVFMADLNGKIIMSPNHGTYVKGSPSSHFDSDLSQSHWFKSAIESTQVTDYFTFSEADHYHQLLLTPIKDASGNTLGVIGFELMIPYEEQLLSNDLSLGETGQIMLVALDGTPVVHKKGEEKSKLVSEGLSKAIETGSWVGHTINSQGVPVVGLYLKNKEHPWILVAEIEEKEVFASVTEIRNYLFLALALTSIIVIVLSLIFANFIVSPIRRISEAAKKIAEGDFNAEVPAISTNDEVQELGDSMLLLTGAIKFLKNEKNAKSKSSKKK